LPRLVKAVGAGTTGVRQAIDEGGELTEIGPTTDPKNQVPSPLMTFLPNKSSDFPPMVRRGSGVRVPHWALSFPRIVVPAQARKRQPKHMTQVRLHPRKDAPRVDDLDGVAQLVIAG
jgi:hypothetical protein